MNGLLEAVDVRGVATITLNHPERHNAFDDVLIASLTASLRRMDKRPDIRVVVLASTGRSFSAGADLGWMRRMATYSEDANLADALALAGLMRTLDRLSKPTVAVVQGAAFGGGVGLLACCDVVVAADTAIFCLSEVRLGLTPATISPYVVRAIGGRQARRYFTTAETFSAHRACDIGLVHEVVAGETLVATAATIVDKLLEGAPGAQRDAKELVFLCEARDDDAALGAETARRIAGRRASAEGREGITAFLSKRPPAWRTNEADDVS